MKNIIKLFCALLVLIVTSSSFANAWSWQKVLGDDTHKYVMDLYIPVDNSDGLIVSANNYPIDDIDEVPFILHVGGNGYKVSSNKGQSWSETKLDSFAVLSIIQPAGEPATYIASVSKNKEGYVLISNDNGNTWDVENPKAADLSYISEILPDPTNKDIFYCSAINTSKGFLKTNDRFETIQTNEDLNIQSRDIFYSKVEENTIYITGDNNHDYGVFKSTDNGDTWEKISTGLENKRVYCFLQSTEYPNILTVGCDSLDADRNSIPKGIYRSENGGSSWYQVAAIDYRVFDIQEHPSNPEFVIAACGEGGVWASASYGYAWAQYNDGIPNGASVRHVAIPDWAPAADGIKAYVATFENGVYLATGGMITKVEDKNSPFFEVISINDIYPMPFNDAVNINYKMNKSANCKIEILDIMGNAVYSEHHWRNEGEHLLRWDARDKAAGMYLLVIESEGKRIVKNLIRN